MLDLLEGFVRRHFGDQQNFPVGEAGLMRFDYIPLSPLRIIDDFVN